jgi:hypothetical protein
MTLILRSLRVVLAVATVALGASALTLLGVPASAPAGAETPLPTGWELCVLQGTGAPATTSNVGDLDGWQLEEGGSTNNTAAYNPFNTGRTTDVTGAALPTVASSGFPAFANWPAGCAATVATLLQPNMAPITAGLRAGNVSPSAAFLALVDQSQWCAPSADGVPCYSNVVLGSASNLAAQVLSTRSTLDLYGNVNSDLHNWQLATLAVTTDKSDVAIKNKRLGAAQAATSSMRAELAATQRKLRSFAVDEYVSTGLYVSSSYVTPGSGHRPFGPPTATGVVAQQYEKVAASGMLARTSGAEARLRASEARRDKAAKVLRQAVAKLSADTLAENRALIRMVADVATLQTAGACTNAAITLSAPSTSPGPAAATAPAATPTVRPTTTTTQPPAPTTTTSTSTTTTTTSSTTTTTTTQPTTVPSSTTTTTTTTTAPPPSGSTTTTTSTPSTPSTPTTSTSTAPGSSQATQPPPKANPAGIQVLQGCVSALAPPGA